LSLLREAIMNKGLPVTILVALTVTAAAAQAPTQDALIARAKSFELETSYVPPPGTGRSFGDLAFPCGAENAEKSLLAS
jgi:hypothetical protein